MDPSMLVLRSKSGQISSEQASIIICFIEDPDQPTLLIFPVKMEFIICARETRDHFQNILRCWVDLA